MTRQETLGIMATLSAAYPSFYRKSTPEDTAAAVALWAEMFKDEEYSIVKAAVLALIKTRTEGWPPNVGEVTAKIAELTLPKEMTRVEAWGLVEEACRNGLYGAREEFEKLPPLIQKAVRSPNQLREWAMMDSDTLKSVVASQFMRSYEIMQKREMEAAMLPENVKGMLQAATERMALNA